MYRVSLSRGPLRLPHIRLPHIELLQLTVYNTSTDRTMCEICATRLYNGWMDGWMAFDYLVRESKFGHLLTVGGGVGLIRQVLWGGGPSQQAEVNENF